MNTSLFSDDEVAELAQMFSGDMGHWLLIWAGVPEPHPAAGTSLDWWRQVNELLADDPTIPDDARIRLARRASRLFRNNSVLDEMATRLSQVPFPGGNV